MTALLPQTTNVNVFGNSWFNGDVSDTCGADCTPTMDEPVCDDAALWKAQQICGRLNDTDGPFKVLFVVVHSK